MASKKPLLSPIPEIPEVFSSVSSPGSPKADALFTEGAGLGNPKSRNACKDILQEAEAGRMGGELLWAAAASSSRIGSSGLSGSLEAAPGTDPKVTDGIVPDAEGGVDTSEYFQQGKETASEKEAKESCSLREKEELQGNLLSGLEILEQQNVQESAQRTQCPQKDSVRGGPARRRRRSSSAICLAPVGNWEITGMDLPVSYNVEEVLCVPEAEEGSLQPCRRKSSSGEVRVRRSMRLSRDAASEGLAWIQLPSEIPFPAPAPKARRRSSTSILAGSENIHPREPNLIPFPAPGKENEGSAPAAAGPGRRWRRRSLCEAKPRETPWAQTQSRRRTSSGYGKDRNNQSHPGQAETLELRLNEVPALSDFLK
ncbi:CDCA2 protein, partial [Ptilonorhynchus violaceus]|nr:CDCA2 protein [Ptilonorhynchus violaceus]